MSTLARGVAFGDGANVATLRYTDDRSEDSFQVRGSQRFRHLAELVTMRSALSCSDPSCLTRFRRQGHYRGN